MKEKLRLYCTLFITTFKISAFTFGGGFVIVPLMKKKFCDELKWIKEDEVLDLIAIAQSSPGAIAVNTSIIIGHRVLGVSGALVAAIATVLPPLVILSVVSFFYTFFKENRAINALLKDMQAGVAAVIVDVVFDMASKIVKKKELVSILLMSISFILVFFFKINLYLLILSGAVTGIVYKLIQKKRKNAI
ncbi:MAG: chromate transporter [Clostridiaceae bacterium]|nr:chromate transporter [Clostridiaceae bacterium]